MAIVHGWRNLGERTMGTSATTINEIATSLEGDYYIDTDGFQYCLIASLSEEGEADVEVWGTWFDSESQQNFNTVINCKVGVMQASGDASFTVSAGTLGCSIDLEWSKIADWADTASTGDAETMGLACRVAGYAGPEMAKTSSAGSGFGSHASDGYIAHKGNNDGPGFVVVPCALFSGLQLNITDTTSGGDGQVGTVLACLIQ